MTNKPVVEVPEGPAPTELQIIDEVEGSGPEARAGSTVAVDYVGVGYNTRAQFDASYDRGEPLVFRLGVGQVIKGWDDGVQGMKVGGRRKLVIPSDQAYGSRGIPGVIQPNEALVFVCELVGVR